MGAFIHDDFLLTTKAARKLYHDYAEDEPIYDYHTHLPQDQIAKDRRFENLYQLWLEGDHYKWRAMRWNGVDERLITGDALPKEKYFAWAATVPHTMRNALYHWTHLELKRFFDIDTLLGPDTAEEIWDEVEEKLRSPSYSVRNLLTTKNVKVVCTTDDPADDLMWHRELAEDNDFPVKVYPTFRPDNALRVDVPEHFNKWIAKLEAASGRSVDKFSDLVEVIKLRHDFFHENGGRLSDHGLEQCFAYPCTDEEAAKAFDEARSGKAVTGAALAGYRAWLMLYFSQLDSEKGWTKQLHLGAQRNNNSRLFHAKGADIGCDSIGDYPQAKELSVFLDTLEQRGHLPKMVVYNVNPRENYPIAACLANFQRDIPGRLQFGSGWWFLDTEEGMQWQINALSNNGLLSRFVGMLTDSRSFLSSTRHEYFRRILCELLGREIKRGALPDDKELVGGMVRRICYGNAAEFFGMNV